MRKALTLLALAAVLLPACNDVPVRTLYKDFGILVKQALSSKERIKIDFLWVMDNSGSMCQEQNSLSRDFKVFIDQLSDFSNIDFRLAVTSTDVRTKGYYQTDEEKKRYTAPGSFHSVPADSFPPGCEVNLLKECYQDSQCAYLKPEFGPNWLCNRPSQASNVINDNGSVNSACHKSCEIPTSCEQDGQTITCKGCLDPIECACCHPGCQDFFGDTYVCNTPPGEEGCLEPPATKGCPTLQPVIDNSQVNEFYCLASLGAEQSQNANLESGIKAGWLALKREADMCQSTSPNVCQLYSGISIENKKDWLPDELSRVEAAIAGTADEGYKAQLQAYKTFLTDCKNKLEKCVTYINPAEPNFLRDDAYLVIFFVSDEEDCSDRDDNPFILNETKTCAFNTAKLAPVKEYVNYYRSLKADPAKVILVGIVGDAVISGSDSCLVPDECVHVRDIDACQCYNKEFDKGSCPELLKGDEQVGMCTAECADDPDPEARKTQWCLASPPTDWCKPEAQAAPLTNCYLLKDIIAAYDKKIDTIQALQADGAAALDSAQQACVDKLPALTSEREAAQGALDACRPKLDEEMEYRALCLEDCLGKKEINPLKRCSYIQSAECGCYDPAKSGTDACKAEFEDEFAYRITCQRVCFRKVKEMAAVVPTTAPYICSSEYGISDFGNRYIDLITRFGRNGIVANLCAAGGIGKSLKQIAESILPIIFRVCIPKSPESDLSLVVWRTSPDGTKTQLLRGSDADYEVISDPQCEDTGEALVFHPVPSPNDRVEIYYQAKPEL
jgi:hypothetical protein